MHPLDPVHGHRRAVQLSARPVGVAVGRVFMDRFCTFVASDQLQQADRSEIHEDD